MARGSHEQNKAGTFFVATLLLWFVSIFFEIIFHKRTELLSVLGGCCFYQLANWVVRYALSRDPLFVNTCVSLLHSTVTSASVIFILVNQWKANGSSEMFEHSQLFGSTWPWAYPALCFSCGYFAYDQWDMLLHRLYSGWIPSILVHHLLLLICFALALYRNVTINYLILTLTCELHSIFLHVRKIRRMAGVRDAKSKIVRLEWIMNCVTFILARFVSHVLITLKLIRDAQKFGKGVELPMALFGMAGMNLLNFFLGVDLFNAFWKERNPRQNNHQE